ncbi:MAG TPA: ornithine cyclodeaminase family protein [Gemmatimonadaceae bacterium]|nr:ornithine cyclodeaminase family protein [Gemmatimonadaceae bacterium]
MMFLDAAAVRELLSIETCIHAVEQAFRLHGEGKAPQPGVLGVHAEHGTFHIKAGTLQIGRHYFAAKTNANFPGNVERFGLPTIQGVIALFDADRGTPLAILDSREITSLRTGAATAVAAKYLARDDASVLAICGCGVQGRTQVAAVAAVRTLTRVNAFDRDRENATRFAREMSNELGIEVAAATDFATAARASDICITCTPSRTVILHAGDVSAGAFVAGVGADNPDKQELDPALLARGAVVVDILDQAVTSGDLHHAIAAGVMTRDDVRAELGAVVAGKKKGRLHDEEIVIFDSTGTALQDVAAAAAVYERAVVEGRR